MEEVVSAFRGTVRMQNGRHTSSGCNRKPMSEGGFFDNVRIQRESRLEVTTARREGHARCTAKKHAHANACDRRTILAASAIHGVDRRAGGRVRRGTVAGFRR